MPIGGSTIHSIIHSGSSADLTNYVYSEVYAGTGGGSAILNGTLVSLAESSSIEVLVRSITGVTGNIYVLGDKKNVAVGSSSLGGYNV